MKTVADLKNEWGAERLARAYVELATWKQTLPEPITVEAFEDLAEKNSDAFELYGVRTVEFVDKLIAEGKI